MPSGTERVLSVISREAIKDIKFYERFYQLVQAFADDECRLSAAGVRDREGHAMDRRHGKLD